MNNSVNPFLIIIIVGLPKDFYALDTMKLDSWNTLIENDLQVLTIPTIFIQLCLSYFFSKYALDYSSLFCLYYYIYIIIIDITTKRVFVII